MGQLRIPVLWWAIVIFTLAGCGDRDGTEMPDAGQTDSGPAAACSDPVTGAGCAGSQRCVWQIYTAQGHPSSDTGACMDVTGNIGNRMPCSETSQNCRAGFACLGIRTANETLCYKVCSLTTRAGCENSSETCSARVNSSANFGACN